MQNLKKIRCPWLFLDSSLDNLYFVVEHSETKKRKDISQILYWLGIELAFLYFGIKDSLVEMFEHFLNMLAMFRYIVGVNEYIIKIDYDIDIQKIEKEVIHELLKDCRSIGKTEEYYKLLKWSIACPKSSLSFITIGNVN